MPHLPPIGLKRKTGNEEFIAGKTPLGFDLHEFWSWSVSDLVSNASRGILAEFLVAKALGVDSEAVRREWDAFDHLTPEGIKVEVKSAAFIQTWHQTDFSNIVFKVPPTRGWDAETNIQAKEPKRHADVYVFALLAHRDQETINPMNLDQWKFFVLPTVGLDRRERSQHSITLPSLRRLCRRSFSFQELRQGVLQAAEEQRKTRIGGNGQY